MHQTVTLQDVYNELLTIKKNMVSRQEVERLMETMEILHNQKTMEFVRSSDADIKAGSTKPVQTMKELISEL